MGGQQSNLNSDLVKAVTNEDIPGVAAHLRAGASPNTSMNIWFKYRRLPCLTYAVIMDNTAIIDLLLKHGAIIEVRGDGLNPPLGNAALTGNLKVVNKLLAEGASTEVDNVNGSRPLYLAAMNGHDKVVMALLAAEAKTDSYNKQGRQAVHIAALQGHLQVIILLKDLGSCYINAKDLENGFTPLHHAASGGHRALCEWVGEAGANPQAEDWEGDTPAHVAQLHGHYVLAKWLLGRCQPDYNSPQEALFWGCRLGDLIQVNNALQAGADPNGRVTIKGDGATTAAAIHEAAVFGHQGVIKALISSKADVTVTRKVRGVPGRCALHLAAECGQLRAVSTLLDNGVDVSVHDDKWSQAIHLASAAGHLVIVQCLVLRGANPAQVDGKGNSPADLANLNGHHNLAYYLQSNTCQKYQ
ncbi:unnamed protein product [Meganyctiphanes norvegica]|uniref:Uncharacterized protein n=1 Tax=Meganyctiphanes norvegica TaxID=48144 RepID=A0AAV2RQJ9_MEGNR